LPVSELEKVNIFSDLDTLAFAQQQVSNLEQAMLSLAAQDDRLPLLVQLPGVGLITADGR
jgi:hypothetical protein